MTEIMSYLPLTAVALLIIIEINTALTDVEAFKSVTQDNEATVFTSSKLPVNLEQRPSVGNGHIATVIKSRVIHMNGVYNGMSSITPSHRAVIPATTVINIVGVASGNGSSYSLDSTAGVYFEEHRLGQTLVKQLIYAHRTISALLVVEIHISRNDAKQQENVHLNVTQWGKSPDIKFFERPTPEVLPQNVSYFFGETITPETKSALPTPVHVLFDHVPSCISLERGQFAKRSVYLTSIHVSKQAAVDGYLKGVKSLQLGELLSGHVTAWQNVWKTGRVDVRGNQTLACMLSGVQYYMLSSMPFVDDELWPFVGLSPTGLPWGTDRYWGHVFWDQETWMYPGILMLHQPLARILLNTRMRTFNAAARNANMTGYKGLRYPWESAFTGEEVSPSEECASQEIHINGDIFLAILQYWQTTNSTDFITKQGFGDIILGLADFWISRMTYNTSVDLYEINGVIPPDEYHNNVNNSVYTNALAQMTVKTAAKVAKMMNKTSTVYEHISERVYVPFNAQEQYHPEYDGYRKGTVIKQADAVLLNFPLSFIGSSGVIANDLNIYSKVTSPDGPAMTWGMMAIGWLQLHRPDLASDNLFKMYANVNGPFQVWSEVTHGRGVPNFLTGMGGFLQTLVFGYGGLRIATDHMKVDPNLPPDCENLLLTGLDYLDNTIDLNVNNTSVEVVVTDRAAHAPILGFYVGDKSYILHVGKVIVAPRGGAVIKNAAVD